MKNITELRRLDAHAPRPQSLAFDGHFLWTGSLETRSIYQIDPVHWTVKWQCQAPGLPWGMTVVGDELRVLCGEGPDDTRNIRRLIPGHGFDTRFILPCPGDTGSQLGWDGQHLHLSQWYKQRVLALGPDGQIERSIPAPRGICGQVIVGRALYLVTTADEETDDYYLTRLDLDQPNPTPVDIARIPFPARALAHDGQSFWTNHRAAHQTISFTP